MLLRADLSDAESMWRDVWTDGWAVTRLVQTSSSSHAAVVAFVPDLCNSFSGGGDALGPWIQTNEWGHLRGMRISHRGEWGQLRGHEMTTALIFLEVFVVQYLVLNFQYPLTTAWMGWWRDLRRGKFIRFIGTFVNLAISSRLLK